MMTMTMVMKMINDLYIYRRYGGYYDHLTFCKGNPQKEGRGEAARANVRKYVIK